MEPYKPLNLTVFIEGVSPYVRNLVEEAYKANAEFYDNLTRDLWLDAKKGKIGGDVAFNVPEKFCRDTFICVMIKKFGMVAYQIADNLGATQKWNLRVWG